MLLNKIYCTGSLVHKMNFKICQDSHICFLYARPLGGTCSMYLECAAKGCLVSNKLHFSVTTIMPN